MREVRVGVIPVRKDHIHRKCFVLPYWSQEPCRLQFAVLLGSAQLNWFRTRLNLCLQNPVIDPSQTQNLKNKNHQEHRCHRAQAQT